MYNKRPLNADHCSRHRETLKADIGPIKHLQEYRKDQLHGGKR